MSDKTPTLEEKSKSPKSSRRSMLRLAVPAAAGVAALAAAGATEALRPGAAHAAPMANGDTIVIGSLTNSGTSVTELAMTSATGGVGAFGGVDESNAGQNSFGLFGNSFNNNGVYGLAGGGILTPDDTTAKAYTGVYGHVHHDNGAGTVGQGYGVVAHANRGAAPLLLISTTGSTANGFPKTSAADGALNVDNNGVLYNHRFGQWAPLSSVVLLSSPIRLLDTRPSQPARTNWGAALAPQQTRALQVAGFTYNGQTIPAGARAIMANITVLGPTSAGNLAVWPTGSAQPQAVALTFDHAGVFLANFNIVGVGSGDQINIQNQSGGNTDLVYDVVGFIA